MCRAECSDVILDYMLSLCLSSGVSACVLSRAFSFGEVTANSRGDGKMEQRNQLQQEDVAVVVDDVATTSVKATVVKVTDVAATIEHTPDRMATIIAQTDVASTVIGSTSVGSTSMVVPVRDVAPTIVGSTYVVATTVVAKDLVS
ncbi:hypothetical protein Dimus_003011 [Dionaea muscipula]